MAEFDVVQAKAREAGAFDAVICTHWAQGGAGAVELAKAVEKAAEQPSDFKFLYDLKVTSLVVNATPFFSILVRNFWWDMDVCCLVLFQLEALGLYFHLALVNFYFVIKFLTIFGEISEIFLSMLSVLAMILNPDLYYHY